MSRFSWTFGASCQAYELISTPVSLSRTRSPIGVNRWGFDFSIRGSDARFSIGSECSLASQYEADEHETRDEKVEGQGREIHAHHLKVAHNAEDQCNRNREVASGDQGYREEGRSGRRRAVYRPESVDQVRLSCKHVHGEACSRELPKGGAGNATVQKNLRQDREHGASSACLEQAKQPGMRECPVFWTAAPKRENDARETR